MTNLYLPSEIVPLVMFLDRLLRVSLFLEFLGKHCFTNSPVYGIRTL